jgi:CRP-like cAMP-binding protein
MAKARALGRTASSKQTMREYLTVNACLRELDEPEVLKVLDGATAVDLQVDAHIYAPGETIDAVFFPIDCVLSVVTRMHDGNMIEIGTIGREGNSAIPLLLGSTTTANECYCQVPGRAAKMSSALFQQLRESQNFTRVLDRFLQAYVNMLGQLAACNRLHTIYQRCARWLLMTHDRVGLHEFELTHEYLAMMLGTQRSGVTIAAATLQKAGFISYGRGKIAILDRLGLEMAACECYQVARDQFAGITASAPPLTYR